MTRKLTYLSSLCSLRNMCGELGSPRWRQVAHHFALTLVGVLTGTDSHALCAPSCGCTFCTPLGPDDTSLDVLRKQLSIASDLAPPHPLPTPSHPSGLSLSLSVFHLSTSEGGQRSDTWYSRSTRQCGPPILRTAPLPTSRA